MSGLPSPQPFSSDDEALSLPEIPSSLVSSQKKFKSQTFLYPIDEADDFYDPFSELSLFLSNKIKKEIQESGTTKKWSGKIEANLLAKILPEFKKQFPRYRLGTAALKKVWDKVSYYYEKIQHHKGAFNQDGKLNLPLMIRENLKTTSISSSSLSLPPYHLAHQIAIKISECIATLEGRRPDLDQLTKIIWAVKKNILRDLSPIAARSPYEDHDKLDKLIVKTLLEICSKYPQLDSKLLKMEILKQLEALGAIQPLIEKSQLTSTLSIVLANKMYPILSFTSEFTNKEKDTLEAFIDMHIQYSEQNETFSIDTHYQELVQRILALYPVIKGLPSHISTQSLRDTIRSIYLTENPLPIHSSLYIFISAEMHLMQDEKKTDKLQKLEDQIVRAFQLALTLPALNQKQLENFELLIWKKLNEQKELLADIPSETCNIIERELGNIVVDKPQQSFRNVIRSALQFFKKIQQLPFHEKENKAFWLSVKQKSEVWALQNEMLCRWIHFDDQNPLFSFLKQEAKHKFSLSSLKNKVLKKFPILIPFANQLQVRLWILQQYFWYSELSNDCASSYDLFLKKYSKFLENAYPNDTRETTLKKLQHISHTMLPLTPFEEIGF